MFSFEFSRKKKERFKDQRFVPGVSKRREGLHFLFLLRSFFVVVVVVQFFKSKDNGKSWHEPHPDLDRLDQKTKKKKRKKKLRSASLFNVAKKKRRKKKLGGKKKFGRKRKNKNKRRRPDPPVSVGFFCGFLPFFFSFFFFKFLYFLFHSLRRPNDNCRTVCRWRRQRWNAPGTPTLGRRFKVDAARFRYANFMQMSN